jgi:molybdopterin-guanine dinucleotide biosynthesis protein A
VLWRSIILAAGRGPDDPMAKAFDAQHKCNIPLAGKPMLQWVLDALASSQVATPYAVVIDDPAAARDYRSIIVLPAANSAPASALAALAKQNHFPTLITTGDHPLLTADMIETMLQQSERSSADILVGLATQETIATRYPETKRTYFNLGGTRVSGCNLFAVMTPAGLKLLERWQDLEKNRKKPWKLVAAFGLKPIVLFAFGLLTPERAFAHLSAQLSCVVKPVFLPFAEAAMDVDKPSDHVIAERILKKRLTPA